MPCTYTGSIEGDRLLAAESNREELSKIITHLTQMLCGVMKFVEDNGVAPHIDEVYEAVPESKEFWNKHKKLDEDRIAREKKIALSKLSDYDLRLLGLTRPKG